MTIYVIDDHPLMREAIAMVIRRLRPTHEVVELDRVGLLSAAIEKHGLSLIHISEPTRPY